MSSRPNLSATRRGPVRVTKVDIPTGPLVARVEPSQNGGKGEGEGVGVLELKSVSADGNSGVAVVEGKTSTPSGNTVGVSVISDSASPVKGDEEEKEEEDTSGGSSGDQ